jgi:uncharacterized membrane protein
MAKCNQSEQPIKQGEWLTMRNRLLDASFLGLLSLFCLSLFVARTLYTGSSQYFFLIWNLFLAAVPWLLTSGANALPGRGAKVAMALLFPLWLLFFPNAPYILTDLFHLGRYSNVPQWFDLIHILCYAWTGLMFGFFSLLDVEAFLSGFIGRFMAKAFSTLLLFIGGFGVYLGRYLRWNSWDIISSPRQLLEAIWDRLSNPISYPGAWGMTLLMGILLNIMYLSFHLLVMRRLTALGTKPARR